jgi:prenylated cyclic peptide (anacyclamide/piricyclamide family)
MTKKNIRPQQVAPVERETISTAKDQSGQVTPLQSHLYKEEKYKVGGLPFAGDDAE